MTRSKAIRKKKDAITRPAISYENKHGGHVFTMNTGIFEQVKSHLSCYYDSINIQKHSVTDAEGSTHTLAYSQLLPGLI